MSQVRRKSNTQTNLFIHSTEKEELQIALKLKTRPFIQEKDRDGSYLTLLASLSLSIKTRTSSTLTGPYVPR
jgi:hypothetical protein